MELRIGIIRDMKAKFGDFVVSALVVAMPLGVALAGTYLPGEGDFDVSVRLNIGLSDYATGIYNYNESRVRSST